MRRVLVLGLGVSGVAAVNYFLSRGAEVIAYDDGDKSVDVEGVEVYRTITPPLFSPVDLVVASPGFPPDHPAYRGAVERGLKVVGEAALALGELPHCCVGVTGTNGKTTVTYFLVHALKSLGLSATAVGNCGVPMTSLLVAGESAATDLLVAELSSYQLETLSDSVLDAALLLNITADHLTRYGSMRRYAEAKVRILDCVKTHGQAVVSEQVVDTFGDLLPKQLSYITYGKGESCRVRWHDSNIYVDDKVIGLLPESINMRAEHDIENFLAAVAAIAALGFSDYGTIIEAYGSFNKPPHRLQYIRAIGGVRFYDDSKATNIDAVKRAVNSFDAPIVLIVGGIDKGESYSSWISSFDGKVKAICAIGEAAPLIVAQLAGNFSLFLDDDLSAAVARAYSIALPGDIVLLSPGCASFDMFTDYVERGTVFQKAVEKMDSMDEMD